MTEATLQKMNRLANGFANERVTFAVDKVMGIFAGDKELERLADLKKEIGKMLAVAYSKGYGDAVENLDVKKLIF